MTLATHLPLRASRAERRRERHAPVSAPVCSATVANKRGGGPEDRALYGCACGCTFQAAVTASVGCPHCGTGQAW